MFAPDWFKTRMTNGHANGTGQGKSEESSEQALSSEATDSVSDMIGTSTTTNVPQSHTFIEHTFKKPTFCEQCRGLLKGMFVFSMLATLSGFKI